MNSSLLQRARQGDESALSAIYEQCHAPIYRYIYFRVRNGPLAEELAAEVFVRMVNRIGSLKDRGRPVLAWLYTIARNLVIDHQRRSKLFTWSPLQEEMEATADEHPVQVAENRQAMAELAQALDQLTEIQRRVIILKFIEGCSNQEIATMLGKDEGAIKSLQHRALGALRRALSAQQSTCAAERPAAIARRRTLGVNAPQH
jgi:RNA polymerase sigma-70 factor (ECF subfamily)